MPRTDDHSAPHQAGRGLHSRLAPALVLTAGAGILATAFAPTIWLVLLTDGLLVVSVLGAAAGWGAWPVVWLGLTRRTVSQQVCLAVGLGLGLLTLFTLMLGVAGFISQTTAWMLLGAGGLLGIGRLYSVSRESARDDATTPVNPPSTLLIGLILLTLAVPAAVGVFGASLPPGVLWLDEAHGYDVLEYHLQGPREWFDRGRIEFLPHNPYTSFPQQMETLYLLQMHLVGSPLAGAIPAQLLHLAMGVLGVVALVAWSPHGWPRCVIAVVAGSVPWLAYVGCLAYVELGLLFFGALAAGLVVDHFRAEHTCDWRTAFAAGLFAGLAGGCKYTALAFVAVALAVAWLFTMRARFSVRIGRIALFAAGATIAFAPWLARNTAFTGNPVYPFAYSMIGGEAWSSDQDAQWARGHQLPDDEDSILQRCRRSIDELFTSRMFGPTLLIVALLGLVLRFSRAAVMLAIWLVLGVLGWMLFTHMPGRFAIPLVIPLAMLAPAAIERRRGHRWLLPTILTIATVGAIANNATLLGLLHDDARWWRQRGVPLQALAGATDALANVQPLNTLLPENANAWLIGEARVFYARPKVHATVAFARDPWLEFAKGASTEDSIAWLRTQKVSHVVFSWAEIERLRGSYGFSELVTRDWVASLCQAGLRRVAFDPEVAVPDIDVYEVLPK